MAIKPGTDEGHAEQEATEWLIALREEPDDVGLRRRFEAWRSASAANRRAWNETEHAYDLVGRAGARQRRRPALGRRGFVAAGAGVALAACLAFLFLPGLLLRLQADHATATAESRTFRLEDGSVLHLGPQSAIDLAYSTTERRVHLLKGEAFFEVEPNPARPFVVEARTLQTTVLGTGFDVRLGSDEIDVAVSHGLVRVDDRSAEPPVSERLTAGEWVRVAGGQVQLGRAPPEQVASWRSGQLIARDRAVADVIDELRRSYDGVIVLADGALGRKRVTGVYTLADPAAALDAVARVHGAVVHRLSPWLLVVSSR